MAELISETEGAATIDVLVSAPAAEESSSEFELQYDGARHGSTVAALKATIIKRLDPSPSPGEPRLCLGQLATVICVSLVERA